MHESIICLARERWSEPRSRSHHLLARGARDHRVVVFEPAVRDSTEPAIELRVVDCVTLLTPHLPADATGASATLVLRRMFDRVVTHGLGGGRPVLWYETPRALAFTDHARARAIVYDCAVAEPCAFERQLFARADVVFTSAYRASLEQRQRAHRPIHAMPSSVDVAHFARARVRLPEPRDQVLIPTPRIGFSGPLDARVDLALLGLLADIRPDLQLVLAGPLVGLSALDVPLRPNVHCVGAKAYDEVVDYLAGWDVALLPFARSAATRWLAPAQMLECLAAGLPVVATPLDELVDPFGRAGLAWIAETAGELSDAIDDALATDRARWLARADAMLDGVSWDRTWDAMWSRVETALRVAA